MADFDEMRSSIKSPPVRALYDEATKAYGAGAFRSSIITIWTAVAFDLTSKVRAMAETGEGDARVSIEKLDKAISSSNVAVMQNFERELLHLASEKLELLTSRDKTELERLQADRHLCAHPNFTTTDSLFSPTPELVKAHIVSAVNTVLSQRPVAGKSQIEILIKEISSDSWPRKDLQAYVMERYFENTRESIQRNLIRVLIKGVVSPEDHRPSDVLIEDLEFRKRCGQACDAVYHIRPELLKEELGQILAQREASGSLAQQQLLNIFVEFGQSSLHPECLPETALTRTLTLLEDGDLDTLVEAGVFTSGSPIHDEIRRVLDSRIDDLSREDISRLIDRSADGERFRVRAVSLLEQSGSFRSAEANMALVVRCCRTLTADGYEKIFDVIRSNEQVLHASGIENALGTLYAQMEPLSSDAKIQWNDGIRELRRQIKIDSAERSWVSEDLYSRLVSED